MVVYRLTTSTINEETDTKVSMGQSAPVGRYGKGWWHCCNW